MKIKKDDKVIVLSGKDKGKQGKVLIADPKGSQLPDTQSRIFCQTQL